MIRLGILGRSPTRGITLVEILVVVACLVILASILFPLFIQIREIGYQTKCASNMEQLTKAFQTYSQDWSDYWPCPGGLKGDYAYWHQNGMGGLTRYIKQNGHHSIWCCPKMPDWKSAYPPRSYCMNSYLREPADIEYSTCTTILKGIRTSCIPRMNQTVLLFEGLPLKWNWEGSADYVYIYRCCNWTGVKGYSATMYAQYAFNPGQSWHGKLNNYIYCDGHLVTRSPGHYYPSVLSSHKEMYDWYVDKTRFETKLWPAWAKAGAPLE